MEITTYIQVNIKICYTSQLRAIIDNIYELKINNMSLTKEENKYFKRLNNLREVVDTDPEWATEYIIELEDELKETIKQLKTK